LALADQRPRSPFTACFFAILDSPLLHGRKPQKRVQENREAGDSHGRQVWINCAWRARRSGVQPLAIDLLQKSAQFRFDFPRLWGRRSADARLFVLGRAAIQCRTSDRRQPTAREPVRDTGAGNSPTATRR